MRVETSQEKYLNSVFGLDLPRPPGGLEFMSLSASEARVLQFLIRGFGVKRVLEIGTLFGYSALCMDSALPVDGELVTLENHRQNWETAQKTLAGRPRVKSLFGEANVLLRTIQGPFDMVFIDANKGGYMAYLDWAEIHIARGGLIVGDNTFLWGGVWDEPSREVSASAVQAMKDFNARLSDRSRYNSILIPTAEGMTIAQKLF